MPLKVGDEAPDVVLHLRPTEPPLRIADYRGTKPVVLLFFPLCFFSVCVREMELVAEDYDRWDALDAEVIAVSVDSPFVTERFAETLGVPFPVTSDFNRQAVKAFDVRDDDFYGLSGVAYRAVFVISREGRIAYAWISHDAEALPDLDAVAAAVDALP